MHEHTRTYEVDAGCYGLLQGLDGDALGDLELELVVVEVTVEVELGDQDREGVMVARALDDDL